MCLLKRTELPAILVIVLLTAACQETSKPSAIYYPMDSLIRAQTYQLAEQKATLTKKAQIDGEEETTVIEPKDSTAWFTELDIFASLHTINKPVNLGNYTVTDGSDDQQTNLTIRTFTCKTNLPVVWLKVFYQEKPQHIRKIEALHREESSLLKGSRMLVMEFQELNNKVTLTSYSIEGGQVLFLGKPVEFTLTGTISTNEWQGANVNH